MNKRLFESYINELIKNFKFPCKAVITKVYTDKDEYFIDCKELDLNDNETDVIFPKVEIPKIWGGEKTAVLCLPSVDSIVSLGFYNGNKNFPFIVNVMGSKFDVEHKENEFIVILDTSEFKISDNTISCKIGDDTSLLIEDKMISGTIGDDTSFIVEDKKITGTAKDVKLLLDGDGDKAVIENQAGCKIEVGSSVKINGWEITK